MMKLKGIIALVAVSFTSLASAQMGSVPAAAMKDGKLRRMYEQRFGGIAVQQGSKQGCIGFVNAQSKIPTSEIIKVVSNLKKLFSQDMRIHSGKVKELPNRKEVESAGLTIAVFAVDDPSLPTLLAAPEERWSLVNVAKIDKGLPKGPVATTFIANRFRAELMRAFSLVAGGASSQYPNNIHTATDLAQLDSMDADALTMDVVMRCQNHLLNNLKIKPERVVSYRMAVQEGWAPAPTNDIQKAIWDKVHAMPTAPIKIKPETKKVRE